VAWRRGPCRALQLQPACTGALRAAGDTASSGSQAGLRRLPPFPPLPCPTGTPPPAPPRPARADWKTRKGDVPRMAVKLPQILGGDVAGTVVEADEGSKVSVAPAARRRSPGAAPPARGSHPLQAHTPRPPPPLASSAVQGGRPGLRPERRAHLQHAVRWAGGQRARGRGQPERLAHPPAPPERHVPCCCQLPTGLPAPFAAWPPGRQLRRVPRHARKIRGGYAGGDELRAGWRAAANSAHSLPGGRGVGAGGRALGGGWGLWACGA
jgi:hypothetical protein